MQMVGERLREARVARGLSLAEVASRAQVSAATLSRIERDKQAIHIAVFLLLAEVLDTAPADLIGGNAADTPDAALAVRIGGMQTRERTNLWKQLTEDRREQHEKKRADIRSLATEVEELLAQMDFLRAAIESVRSRLTNR